MKVTTMSNASNTSTAPSTATVAARDWAKEKANRLNLPRFNEETVLLCQLVPFGTTDEVAVKAIDWLRGELAKLASDSANSGELGKISKLSKKDGTRKLTVKGEAIVRNETPATWIARIAKVRAEFAKEIGCPSKDIPIPADSSLALEIENLTLRLSK